MSRVDVVVPAYNHARFLEDCVRSIVSQSVDLRVLIVDDCSCDDTPAVAAALVARDSRVQYRRHSTNVGATTTFNECLDWATADYTHLIAADDQLTPGALGRNIAFLDAQPTIGFVYGRMIVYKEGDPFPSFDEVRCPPPYFAIAGKDFIEQACRGAVNVVPTLTATVRTSVQKRIGGYRPWLPLTHDMEMWLRFAAVADVGRIDADQAVYRIHGNNLHLKFDEFLGVLEYKKTFDSFFSECGNGLENAANLLALADGALAKRILFAGHSAFESGNNALTGEILATARAVWGAHVPKWSYRRLLIKHKVGPRSWRVIKRLRKLWQG